MVWAGEFMKRSFGIFIVMAALAVSAFSQKDTPQKPTAEKPATPAAATPIDLARAAIAAHGGDKFQHMRSLLVMGTAEVTGAFSQIIPATFRFIIAGDRYMFELNNSISPLKQVFDGKQTYSSGYELPPMTSLGFPLLPKVGVTGYAVDALPEAKKKRKGFRMTTPDGFYTDFFVDEKTGQIKGYESSYEVDGRIATTSVEVDEVQMVEGVTIPKKYSQRFDIGQITAYANFNTKQILVNSTIADNVFAMPK
jgi:hypothetical protein